MDATRPGRPLREIHDFIARDSPRAAEVLVERLLTATERLASFPESGRVVPEFPGLGYREIIVGSYRVLYDLRETRSGLRPSSMVDDSLVVSPAMASRSPWLCLQVEPVDAEVFVDGFRLPLDPATGRSASIGLLIGKHWVEARKEGFEPVQTEVEIQQVRELLLRLVTR